MKLTKIIGRSVKGLDFNHDIAPATVFVGRFGTGKTAVMDALKLALLGYHPALGNRPNLTMKLAGGMQMTAGAAFTDGFTETAVKRTWDTTTGAVRVTEAGEAPDVPALLFDLREYLSMTGKERLNYVLRGMPVETMTLRAADVIAEIQSLVVPGANKHTEQAVKWAVVKARNLDQENLALTEFLERLRADVQEEAKVSKRRVETMASTIAGYTALVGSGMAAADRTHEIDEAARRLEAKVEEVGGLHAAGLARAAWEKDVAQTTIEIEMFRDAAQADFMDVSELAELEIKLKDIPKPDMVGFAMAKQSAQAQVDSAVRDMRGALAGLEKEEAGLRDLAATPCCPYCKGHAKGWQRHMSAAMQEAAERYKRIIVEVKTRSQLASEGLGVATAALNEAMRVNASREQIVERVDRLRGALAESRDARAALPILTAQLEKLQANPVPPADGFRKTELETEILLVRQEADALRLAQKAWYQKQAAEEQLARALTVRDLDAAAVEVLKQVGSLLVRLSSELVATCITGLMTAANHLCGGILPYKLEFKNGDFGYINPAGVWVSHEVFSGTETAVSYAALSVALAFGCPLRLVVIDELGVIDLETKLALVRRMVELVSAGFIDGFIGADVATAGYPETGVSVIEVA